MSSPFNVTGEICTPLLCPQRAVNAHSRCRTIHLDVRLVFVKRGRVHFLDTADHEPMTYLERFVFTHNHSRFAAQDRSREGHCCLLHYVLSCIVRFQMIPSTTANETQGNTQGICM